MTLTITLTAYKNNNYKFGTNWSHFDTIWQKRLNFNQKTVWGYNARQIITEFPEKGSDEEQHEQADGEVQNSWHVDSQYVA